MCSASESARRRRLLGRMVRSLPDDRPGSREEIAGEMDGKVTIAKLNIDDPTSRFATASARSRPHPVQEWRAHRHAGRRRAEGQARLDQERDLIAARHGMRPPRAGAAPFAVLVSCWSVIPASAAMTGGKAAADPQIVWLYSPTSGFRAQRLVDALNISRIRARRPGSRPRRPVPACSTRPATPDPRCCPR